MKKYKITFTGVSPLLMHSCRGANPLDPDVKYMKTITGKRTKTDEDHMLLIKLEYKLNAYFKDGIGFYIPANILEQAIIGGSKKIKLGKKMPTAINIIDEYNKLEITAPHNLEQCSEMHEYMDVRYVVVNRAKIMRTRPRFDKWKVTFMLELDDSIINDDQLFESLNYAGSLVGICDYRPDKGGKYGRFEVGIEEI